jgi:hypothetical protein
MGRWEKSKKAIYASYPLAAKLDNRDVEWTFSYEKGTPNPWVSRIRFTETWE